MPEQGGFNGTVDRVLANPTLQRALDRATASCRSMRNRAVDGIPEFEDLRRRARDAKDKVLADMGGYLERLEASITGAGGRVFWAADASAAVNYIVSLAADRGVRSVVKGKSMTTEEIELNPALQAAGIDVLETDLGEYIIQLAGEKPSHIVGPALHKTKEDVAVLLEKHLGLAYTDDPEVMTLAVRRELRARFLAADMGITGANMAVAETGTIVLFENEGNIRMSTTLPRIHVAVMGIEKMVADIADLEVLMRVLPVSAVGQRLSSYVSLITGPGRREGEGPEELHVVFLDGFRTKLLADPDFASVLRCLRCGACLNVCPTYRRIGGHSYPSVYSGPIGAVLAGTVLAPEKARGVVSASTLCRACSETCPVMIDLADLILRLRTRMASDRAAEDLGLTALGRLFAGPAGFDLATRAAAWASGIVSDDLGRPRLGPAAIKTMARHRRMPEFAEPFHRRFEEDK